MKSKKINSLVKVVVSLLVIFFVFVLGYLVGTKVGVTYKPPAYLSNTSDDQAGAADFSLFWQAWNKTRELYVGTSDPQEMVWGAISGMVASLGDPYSTFLKPSDNKKLSEDLSGKFQGIGAELTMENNQITVVAPLSGSPAEKAGIKAKDIIAQIDGTSTADLSLDQAVDKIRGQAGTQVILKIARAGAEDLIEFKITRENIKIDSITYDETNVSGKKIGVIKINQFGDDTLSLANQYADKAKSAGVKGIILDLRNNPGGYLDTSVDISGLFLGKNILVVSEVDKKGEKKEYKTNGDARLKDVPLVVLVNGGSASAAEIVTGALKDHQRAKIIGEKTFGKGSVQALEPLFGGASLKITIAKWLTPLGTEINGKGIPPDIEVKLTDDDRSQKIDPQMERAKAEVVK